MLCIIGRLPWAVGSCGVEEVGKLDSPQEGVFKFNLNRAAREKPGLAGIGGVLRNSKEAVLMLFSKQVSIKQSNEVDVMAILEALRLYAMFFVVTS